MRDKGQQVNDAPRGRIRLFGDILKETVSRWFQDNVPHLAAALAFYTVFSLAPLLVLVISIAGFALGEQAARGELAEQIQNWAGPNGAILVQDVLGHAKNKAAGATAAAVALIALLLGASAVFVELKSSLNIIWRVTDRAASGLKGFMRARALSFFMILALGMLLMLSTFLGTVISMVANLFSAVPHGSYVLLRLGDVLVSLILASVFFGLVYKVLPDTQIDWGDVWLGAIFTAALFTVGKNAIGLYLAYSGIESVYGAAGSLAVFLLWVYYSAQVFLFGAELTAVYARRYGSRTRESKGRGGVIRLKFSPSAPR